MSDTFPVPLQLRVVSCSACCTRFAVDMDLVATRRKHNFGICCPAGHETRVASSEFDEAMKQLTNLKSNESWAKTRVEQLTQQGDAMARRMRSLRGVITKMKKRRPSKE